MSGDLRKCQHLDGSGCRGWHVVPCLRWALPGFHGRGPRGVRYGVGEVDSCAGVGRISRRNASNIGRRRSKHVLFVCPVRKIPNICCQRLQVDNRVSVIFPHYAERSTFCGTLSIGRRRARHRGALPEVHIAFATPPFFSCNESHTVGPRT